MFLFQSGRDILQDYEYDDSSFMGEGGFGRVYKAKDRETGEIRALKHLYNSEIMDPEQFKGEVDNLKKLDHPNIVKLIEMYQTGEDIWLVQEFCEGGELLDRIQQKEKFSEPEACFVFLQMVNAINYCHLNKVCHRDVKPDNFMFSDNQPDALLKLIDFGLSRDFLKLEKEQAKTIRMQSRTGTSLYMAPEVMECDYNEKCDFWSLGVILYIMLCGYPPFEGTEQSEIYEQSVNLKYEFHEEEWEGISDEAKNLIGHLMTFEDNRFGTKQIL